MDLFPILLIILPKVSPIELQQSGTGNMPLVAHMFRSEAQFESIHFIMKREPRPCGMIQLFDHQFLA